MPERASSALGRLAVGYGLATLAAVRLTPTGRSLMVAAAGGRVAYGLATLFAPRFVAGRWAAAEPQSVMNLRGFGGQHIAIGVFTVASSRSRHLARPAAVLNVGVELCDAVAGGFEVRERGTGESIAMGGLVLPFFNLATWLCTLRRLQGE